MTMNFSVINISINVSLDFLNTVHGPPLTPKTVGIVHKSRRIWRTKFGNQGGNRVTNKRHVMSLISFFVTDLRRFLLLISNHCRLGQ